MNLLPTNFWKTFYCPPLCLFRFTAAFQSANTSIGIFCSSSCFSNRSKPQQAFPCIYERRRPDLSANFLIAFENAISASADGISLSADALIVAERAKEEAEYGQNLSPPQILFLCCHVVTLSHFRVKAMKWFVLYAWQQCDNKNFVVTHLTYCISSHYLIRDNVTTKNVFYG